MLALRRVGASFLGCVCLVVGVLIAPAQAGAQDETFLIGRYEAGPMRIGQTLEELRGLLPETFLLTEEQQEGAPEEFLGKLTVLTGVKEYPMRVKCATLAWHTMHAALHEQSDTVTTE